LTFLARIVKHKLEENRRLLDAGRTAEFQAALAARPAPLSLKAALDAAPGPAIIAEVKRASPSKGEFAMHWDPVNLARIYQDNGAAVISVLTETAYFKGAPEFIPRMRPVIRIPLLRKDFILEPVQIYESAALGADALLLIVSLLNQGQLRALLLLTHSLGMEALVEVHTQAEMDMALAVGARVIGINSRDLHTFQMHPERALELAPLAPPEATLVAASGIKDRGEVERHFRAGIRGFLIGETLVRASDPGARLREFLDDAS
jgi:indole-3-glycerol phosphate synthase